MLPVCTVTSQVPISPTAREPAHESYLYSDLAVERRRGSHDDVGIKSEVVGA